MGSVNLECKSNNFSYVLVCKSKEKGGQTNKPCIFPWKYNKGTTIYEGCANPSNSAAAWCATGVTNGAYISGSGKWGWCKMDYEGGNCVSSGMCSILDPLLILD